MDPVFQAKMLDMLKQTGRSDLNSNTHLQLQYSLFIINVCDTLRRTSKLLLLNRLIKSLQQFKSKFKSE